MFDHEVNLTLFRGALRPHTQKPDEPFLELRANTGKPTLYSVLSQSAADIAEPDNSPSVSMWTYLLASAQTQRLNEISIYSERGSTPEKIRFLYLNDCALAIWREMKKQVNVVGRIHRPPRGATLAFGMPFAE